MKAVKQSMRMMMMFDVAAREDRPLLRVAGSSMPTIPKNRPKPDMTNIVASPDGTDSLRISHCCFSDRLTTW